MGLTTLLFKKWLEESSLVIDSSKCLNYKFPNSCQSCVDTCPHQALEMKDNQIHLKWDRCTECMNCTTTCPTEAIYHKKYPNYIDEMDPKKKTITCNKLGKKNAHECISCLFELDTTLLVFASTQKEFVDIYYNEEVCQVCNKYNSKLSSHITNVIDTSNYLVDPSFSKKAIRLVDTLEIGDLFKITRRGLLKQTSNKAKSQVIQTIFQTESEHQKVKDKVTDLPKQIFLCKTLSKLYSEADEKINFINEQIRMKTIHINIDQCTLCEKCVGVCPSSSIKKIINQDRKELIQVTIQCIGCDLCKTYCPENAISIESNIAVPYKTEEYQTLVSYTSTKCPKCGKEMINNEKCSCIEFKNALFDSFH